MRQSSTTQPFPPDQPAFRRPFEAQRPRPMSRTRPAGPAQSLSRPRQASRLLPPIWSGCSSPAGVGDVGIVTAWHGRRRCPAAAAVPRGDCSYLAFRLRRDLIRPASRRFDSGRSVRAFRATEPHRANSSRWRSGPPASTRALGTAVASTRVRDRGRDAATRRPSCVGRRRRCQHPPARRALCTDAPRPSGRRGRRRP